MYSALDLVNAHFQIFMNSFIYKLICLGWGPIPSGERLAITKF